MKMYLVKKTCIATDKNRTYKEGCKVTYFTGKGGKLIGCTGTPYLRQTLLKCLIKEYGYKREGDAKRSLGYRNPEVTEYWNSTAEIITVTV